MVTVIVVINILVDSIATSFTSLSCLDDILSLSVSSGFEDEIISFFCFTNFGCCLVCFILLITNC